MIKSKKVNLICRDYIKHIGKLIIDESALTGESLPVTKKLGESLRMGSSVIDEEAEAEVMADDNSKQD